jgi:hypothetical protein
MWTQDGSDLAQERSSKVRYGQARKHGTGFFISNRPAVRLFGTLTTAALPLRSNAPSPLSQLMLRS